MPNKQIIYLDPRELHPMPSQPRLSMDQRKVQGLADTFRSKGFRGAIIIWYPQPNYAEIISGHRSHTAFMIVAAEHNFQPPWHQIPCAPFADITEGRAYELAILYNEKREDLTLHELAISWKRLVDQYNYTTKQIAESFETSHSTVSNTISILNEPDYIIKYIKENKLKLADILSLRRIKNQNKRRKITQQLVDGEIAKSDLPKIAKQLNRQYAVVNQLPIFTNQLDPQEKKKHGTRLKIHIPEDFTLYFTLGAAAEIDWTLLPQRHILVSGYHILHAKGRLSMVSDMVNRRDLMDSLMIDSSSIIAMGKGDTEWFKRQPELVEFANAVEADIIVHLDVLCKKHLLEKCDLTIAGAQKHTIDNAVQMLDLKTKAKKCFVLQGTVPKEYKVCLDAYNDYGILNDPKNIIGVGSLAGERRQTTVDRYTAVCKMVRNINPDIGIHAFGIGSPWTLVKLYEAGVTQADNQTPAVLTRTNQWIDARTGEPSKGTRLCDERITAMYNAQMLWNFGAYFIGLSNEFKRHNYDISAPSYEPVDGAASP